MRIITGKYKGRVIRMPKGIRPTQDKVRKALFDILQDIKGLSFLELFAGSGAVGIEALSQGAKEVVFVEQDTRCAEAIKDSLAVIGLSDNSVIGLDALQAIKRFSQNNKKFDIIFLDPPYYKSLFPRPYDKLNKRGSGSTDNLQEQPLSKKTLQILGAYDILAPNGFIIVQHFKKDELPEESGRLRLIKEARYADTLLSFYKKHSSVYPREARRNVPDSDISW